MRASTTTPSSSRSTPSELFPSSLVARSSTSQEGVLGHRGRGQRPRRGEVLMKRARLPCLSAGSGPALPRGAGLPLEHIGVNMAVGLGPATGSRSGSWPTSPPAPWYLSGDPDQVRQGENRDENLVSSDPITRRLGLQWVVTFRLGSADRTVSGLQEYRLSYTYRIGDDRNDEYDEFYYNLLGDGWQAPSRSLSSP